MREKDPGEITPLIDKSFSFSVQRKWKLKEGEQGCGEPIAAGAGCDWLGARPRPTWLDMGIYWRQPHQSAPHLINEPKHCMDQEVYTSHRAVCAVSWSKLQQVSRWDIGVFMFTLRGGGTQRFGTESAVHYFVFGLYSLGAHSLLYHVYCDGSTKIQTMCLLCMVRGGERSRCSWTNILFSSHCR